MSETLTFVYLQHANSQAQLVGRLYTHERRGHETASFEYDSTWLTHPDCFALEPSLSLHRGQFHTPAGRALFASLTDTAPDRWGRTLMRRAERKKAQQERREPRTLREIDFLLQVDDESRQGALRFSTQLGGPYMTMYPDASHIPPLVELPHLLSAAHHLAEEKETDADLQALLAPGSSLGGARPKASVRDRDGSLLIAKFPHPEDEVNLPAWESLALNLAAQAGILVAKHRLEQIGQRSVLLLERFDRRGPERLPFLSMMSLLNAADNEQHTYLEIAEALRQYSAAPLLDLKELWCRMVLNILIANVDDHLRNHALLRPTREGWRLSPAYDLNPTPADMKPRRLSTVIVPDDPRASVDLALSVAEHFYLKPPGAQGLIQKISLVVKNWRQEAKKLKIASAEIDRMASAFESAG